MPRPTDFALSPAQKDATMKNAHETLSLRELATVLRTLCHEGHTGTLFLSTDANHSARIGIEKGRIFSVAYGKYRGIEAIEQIKKIQHGKFSFAESIFNNAAEVPLPPTGELLSQLELVAVGDQFGGSNSIASPGRRDVPLDAAPMPARVSKPESNSFPVPSANLDDSGETLRLTGIALYNAVTEALALSIGPVASVVCEDFRKQLVGLTSPSTFRTIASEIAAETGSNDEAGRFLARALAAAGLRRG
jgi:hypothetical protein